ncbi:MAG: molybdenum cofactor biosynthesis protein MoaE [Ginsengibacter sp.]
MINIKISDKPLDIPECINWAMSPQCGGIDMFIGAVRNITDEKMVTELQYEAYEKMALSEMKKIAEQALQDWPVQKVLIHHRKGILQIGEIAVVIAVSAPHREAAFDACRFAIDTLKKTVPIWKKEIFEDGEVWVAAHP